MNEDTIYDCHLGAIVPISKASNEGIHKFLAETCDDNPVDHSLILDCIIELERRKKMLKRGTKFRIAPYGVCVVSSYDDTSGKYIMRVWNSSETFYASEEEISNKCLTNH